MLAPGGRDQYSMSPPAWIMARAWYTLVIFATPAAVAKICTGTGAASARGTLTAITTPDNVALIVLIGSPSWR